MSLILDLIFPKNCYGCGQRGVYLCPKCQKDLFVLNINPPSNNFDGGICLFRYNSFIKSAIVDLKYNFIFDISDDLADLMAKMIKTNFPNLVNYWQQNNFTLTPIPLSQFRQNWRGFNQSEIISQKLAQKLSLNFSSQILFRHQNTQTQAKLKNTKDRIKNVNKIFSLCEDTEKLKNKNFIIFDDVSTTRSTLNSAQETLKALHPNQCWFLTLADG